MKFLRLSLVICLNLVSLLREIQPARIFGIFPTPSISHQMVFRALTEELARRGHELIVLTTDPAYSNKKHPLNVTEIDVHDESYKIFIKAWEGGINEMSQLEIRVRLYHLTINTVMKMLQYQFTHPKIQKILTDSNEQYDLILVEESCNICLYFGYKLKAPVISISSFEAQIYTMVALGAPIHPILYKDITARMHGNGGIYAKLFETISFFALYINHWRLLTPEYEFAKKYFGDDIPTMPEIKRNVDMVFVNVNPLWDGVRAFPPNVINMGGLHMKPRKELPEVGAECWI